MDDGMFECAEHHVHDRTGLYGPTGEGAPCPNDPESPNAYPNDDGPLTYKMGLLDGHKAAVERIRLAFMASPNLTFGKETVEFILNREEQSLD